MSYPDYFHDPYLNPSKSGGMCDELQRRYQVLREQFSGIDRYSIALHHPTTHRLTTFIWGGEIDSPLKGYSVPVNEVPALKHLASGGNVRVVNDMRGFRQEGGAKHSTALLGQGLRSSLTMPISYRGQWLGLMFLNSKQIDYFNRSVVVYCTLWAQWVGQALGHQLTEARRLSTLASKLNHKDVDCNADKVAGIVHLMSCQLLEAGVMNDQEIHYLSLYTPLYLLSAKDDDKLASFLSDDLPFAHWLSNTGDESEIPKRQVIELAHRLCAFVEKVGAMGEGSDSTIKDAIEHLGAEAKSQGFQPAVMDAFYGLLASPDELAELLNPAD